MPADLPADQPADLPGVPLQFMQSSGGLTDARRFHGKDSILSGPAGGIVGMARTSATNSALIVALGPLVSSLLAAIAAWAT